MDDNVAGRRSKNGKHGLDVPEFQHIAVTVEGTP